MRSVSSSLPRTYVGLWLRAILLREREEYRRLVGSLNGGRKGWNDDEPAVITAACELVARQYFGAAYEARIGAAFVADMRRRIEHSKTPPDQLDMEAVLRVALGEKGVDVMSIKPSEVMSMQVALMGAVSGIRAFDSRAVDKLVVEAERLAFERGWAPPLAA